jgi:benzodiazapine receptor
LPEIPRFGPPWLTLILSVGGCVAVGVVSSLLTRPEISGWYASLAKPSFNPPNWIFGPVWTTLYILIGNAAWLVWLEPVSHLRTLALLCFAVQLALNFFWSLIFFRWHSTGGALVEIAVLWLAIALTHMFFWHVRQLAGALILPYLAWVSFAAILNAAIYRLNR